MRTVLFFLLFVFLLGCDPARIYEKNQDFDQRFWLSTEQPEFEFLITDTATSYNVYGNVRNTIAYPFARLFFTYSLRDSLGNTVQEKLVDHTLFDPSSGKPQGTSGLGDIYDHQIPLLAGYRFSKPGAFTLRLEQFMRQDTLPGVLAVGVRVEKVLPD